MTAAPGTAGEHEKSGGDEDDSFHDGLSGMLAQGENVLNRSVHIDKHSDSTPYSVKVKLNRLVQMFLTI
jgi:hypothetical protein